MQSVPAVEDPISADELPLDGCRTCSSTVPHGKAAASRPPMRGAPSHARRLSCLINVLHWPHLADVKKFCVGNRQYAFHYFRNYDWQNADWFCKMTHGSWASLAELHDGKEVEGVMNFVKTVGARQRSSARGHAYALTAKSPAAFSGRLLVCFIHGFLAEHGGFPPQATHCRHQLCDSVHVPCRRECQRWWA